MTVDAKDFLQCARALLSLEPSEINCRSAISRAYYSVFHTCNEFHNSLSTPGMQVIGGVGSHENLLQQLNNPTIKKTDPLYFKSKSLSYSANLLKKKRTIADYRLTNSVSTGDAEQAIEDALKIKEIAESK